MMKNKNFKLKKLMLFSFIFSVFILAFPIQQVSAKDAEFNLIKSEGFITSGLKGTDCFAGETIADKAEKFKDNVKGNYTEVKKSPDEEEEDESFLEKHIGDTFISLVQKTNELLTVDIGGCEKPVGLGLVQQLFILDKPVTVTNVNALMGVTSLVIWLSLSALIFSLLGYSYRLLKGDEETDPIKYSGKFVGVAMLVYYAPYFIQDIININNSIVNAIGNFPVSSSVSGLGTTDLDLQYILPLSVIGFISAIAAIVGLGAFNFVSLLIMIVLLGFTLVPLVKIISWWYLRLFKLFMYTAISPIMFATLLFPSVSKTGQKFIKNVVTESFSQTFVVLGLLVFASYMSVIPSIVTGLNGGIIGFSIAFYVGVKFLEDLPGMAASLIEGGTVGKAGGGVSDGLGKLSDKASPYGLAKRGASMRANYLENKDKKDNKVSQEAMLHAQQRTARAVGGEGAISSTSAAQSRNKSR